MVKTLTIVLSEVLPEREKTEHVHTSLQCFTCNNVYIHVCASEYLLLPVNEQIQLNEWMCSQWIHAILELWLKTLFSEMALPPNTAVYKKKGERKKCGELSCEELVIWSAQTAQVTSREQCYCIVTTTMCRSKLPSEWNPHNNLYSAFQNSQFKATVYYQYYY